MSDLTISEHEAGQRLDRFLRKLLPTLPLGAIFKHLRQGTIRVDGRKVQGDLRLERGMQVEIGIADLATLLKHRREPAAGAAAPAPMLAVSLSDVPRIVRQEESFLVLSKPPGLAVHGGTGIRTSVVDWLQGQRFGVRTATWRPAPAHRLDRGTSGLLVVGLTPDALRRLTAAFRDGQVSKVYHAAVQGIPAQRSGSIVAPLTVDEAADGRVAKVRVDPAGLTARTDYEVLRTERHLALLRVKPHEGRQHQIRVHLAHLGHVIVGDQRYGSLADTGKGFHLHCSELTFPHPVTGQTVRVAEPVPPVIMQLFKPE